MGSIHGGPVFPFVERLAQSAQNMSNPVGGASLASSGAVMAGWGGLHEAMSSCGIHTREGLSEWVHAMGFPLLDAAVSQDARVRVRASDMASV